MSAIEDSARCQAEYTAMPNVGGHDKHGSMTAQTSTQAARGIAMVRREANMECGGLSRSRVHSTLTDVSTHLRMSRTTGQSQATD